MYEIKVSGMTCGGCVNSITAALKSLDSKAKVTVNLKSQIVTVESDRVQNEIVSVIEGAGYLVIEAKKLH